MCVSITANGKLFLIDLVSALFAFRRDSASAIRCSVPARSTDLNSNLKRQKRQRARPPVASARFEICLYEL